jgi:phosphinothricin acetyltransferase
VSSSLRIRPLAAPDWAAVRRIFEEGLATGHSTLETVAPTWEAWDASHLTAPRLVAEREATAVAWAALSPVSTRAVYRGVAEVSVYVAALARGQGVGRALLAALVTASEQAGLWTLQATILAENTASIALHQGAGFRVVGRRERLGRRLGVWRDSFLLERRSRVVEVDP